MKSSTGKFSLGVETEEDQFSLLRAIARSESIVTPGVAVRNYVSILKHPLPPSDHRSAHLETLRYVLSCRLELQAVAAISKGLHTPSEKSLLINIIVVRISSR